MTSPKRNAAANVSSAYAPFASDWAEFVHAPEASDNKYSRGVVGFLTGSVEYPGAAILSVCAAIRFGVGMVRFIGADEVRAQVIAARPEVVAADIDLRPLPNCAAWVVGSGVPSVLPADDSAVQALHEIATLAREAGLPLVVDAGALEWIDLNLLGSNCILTPHAGEALRLLARFGVSTNRAELEADSVGVAQQLANLSGAIVLLKGSRTVIAAPGDVSWHAPEAPAALATAGTGDVLAGVLGAIAAANAGADLFELAKFVVWLHAQSAHLAAQRGPIAALDLTETLRAIVGEILEGGYVND
ncbi:MAG: NAD(P)H-hydrate dehydratase [Actinomycetales bacterium]|nr:NAD(P)H-hydrate dehydratase [Actinomycetales bacterium]